MSSQDRNAGKDHFDLLPFIAILMCVLGCLLLVTMSIAALSIGPGVGEGWLPARDPNKRTKTPVLIEWDGRASTIHYNQRKIEAEWASATCCACLRSGATQSGWRSVAQPARVVGSLRASCTSMPRESAQCNIG